MPTTAKVVADSIGPHGIRLATLELTYPLIIHSELMTHRVFSRNTASNRAIPVKKMIESVELNPFIPDRWPKNGKGMQPGGYWPDDSPEADAAKTSWLLARDKAVHHAKRMQEIGVHKQITNRLLGPFLHTTAVVSATEWANFANLRVHPDAQDQFFKLARLVLRAYFRNKSRELEPGDWHLPYITDDMIDKYSGPPEYAPDPNSPTITLPYLALVSIGICAGISYLRPTEDVDVAQNYGITLRLAGAGHWSPFEHVAQCLAGAHKNPASGNFMRGYVQARKLFLKENRNKFDAEALAQAGIVYREGYFYVEGDD